MEGLGSKESLNLLLQEAYNVMNQWDVKSTTQTFCKQDTQFFGIRRHPLMISRVCSVLLMVGSVNIENEISTGMLSLSTILFLFTIVVEYILKIHSRNVILSTRDKALRVIKSIEKMNLETLSYPSSLGPQTEDMSTQMCLRDGSICNVPRLLLVSGDVILLRPSQIAPCTCYIDGGQTVGRGERLSVRVIIDEETDAAVPIGYIKARVATSPLVDHLKKLKSSQFQPPTLYHQIHYVMHVIGERYVLPAVVVLSIIAVSIRFFYATEDSLFGTRFAFAIPSLIILPITFPMYPLLVLLIEWWNNRTVLNLLCISAYDGKPTKDYVSLFGNLTEVSFIDKKGLLSPVNPCLDKVIFFRFDENTSRCASLIPYIMDLSSKLSSDGKWILDFDDPNWERFARKSLAPIAQNLLLNSCDHNDEYYKFLDHLTCVSESVPRTIATANRRCMCQLPILLGFDAKSIEQFTGEPPTTIGFYKRQPGDAPLLGLTKHRTPMEMAFCTLHSDDRSLHSHLSCQGTASLVLDACSHVWNGTAVVPLESRTIKSAKDFYHRHSMTGYCLAISYRPVSVSLNPALIGKYIEIPLNHTRKRYCGIPRSHSIDSVLNEKFFHSTPLSSADDVIEDIFSGHILCGMVVMQYEALPAAVQLLDHLENSCIRFVYFSKENELRSRVFAEKLGLEAGWNCHVSLAEEDMDSDDEKSIKDLFLASVAKHRKQWTQTPQVLMKRKRLSNISRSDVQLHSLDCESLLRVSPSNRRSSSTSCTPKTGLIPNKARLPRGVNNIRPHLNEVDNVPLLVGLLTDCTPKANAEMINIMQEYGEVVLVIGSSLNIANIDAFPKAYLSICVEPMVDGNCCMHSSNPTSQHMSAKEISGRLMSIATDFDMTNESLHLLPLLISACRHRFASVQSSLHFLFFTSCTISLTTLMSAIFALPLIFSFEQIFLTVFIQIPTLSFGTIWTSFVPKRNVIRIATKNVDRVTHSGVSTAASTFLIQFLPTAVFLIVVYFLMLIRNSNLICSFSDAVCMMSGSGTEPNNLPANTIRHILGFHLAVYLCVLSSSWVYSLGMFWVDVPFIVLSWIFSCIFCLTSQVIFSYSSTVYLHQVISMQCGVALLVWSIVIFIINELCKVQTIRKFAREQRRTKLDFDTKLGMNSPY